MRSPFKRPITLLQTLARQRFLRDTAILQSGQVVIIIVQALSNILVIRILAPDALGVYTLIVALESLVGLLDLSGSQRVVLTQLASATAGQDRQEIQDILAYFLRINLQINIPLVVIFFALAPGISQLLYQNQDIGLWARWLIFIELTDIPNQLVRIVYQCRGEMRRLVNFETSKVFVTSLVMVGTLLLGWKIPGLVLGTLGVNVVYALWSIRRYQQVAAADANFPTWITLLRSLRAVKVWERLRPGLLIAFDKNISVAISRLTILLLGTLGTSFVGAFSVALQVVTLPQPLVGSIARNLDSFLPKHIRLGNLAVRETFIQMTLYTGAIWALITLGIGIFGPFMIIIVFPKYLGVIPLIYPLLLQSLAIGLGVAVGPTIRTLRKMPYSIAVGILTLVLMLPIGLWALDRFGGYGAAWFVGLLELWQDLVMVGIMLWLLRSPKIEPIPVTMP